MKYRLFSLFVALAATTVLWASNVITYTATKKLPETTSTVGAGLHTNAFNVAITSHTFSNGTGTITFAGEVTTIGKSAFEYCSNLTSITIPNSVTAIGERAFYICSGLTSVTIPNSVTKIGERAFYCCSGLTKTNYTGTIADWCKINFYGDEANPINYSHNFYINNEKVTDLVIPNSVTTIGGYAFLWCTALTSITIPNSVTTIGGNAFYGCSGLTSITIPNSVTTIGEKAFCGCKGLTSITIPNSVTTIGKKAFCGCKGLTSITIPNSVTTIGYQAFEGCSGLTSVTILNPVVKIGESAFYGCTITDLYCGKSVDFYNANGKIKNAHRLSDEELLFLLPFDQYARQYVEPRINEWQKKGEFEKTEDWQKRVNETTRKQQIETLVRVAKKDYLAHYPKIFKRTFTLGTYDADNEVYLVQSSNKEDLLVAVPFADASFVKQNWGKHKTTLKYDIQGTEVFLTSVVFSFPKKKTYTYKPDQKLTYSTPDINYNFDPIELPEMQTVTMGGAAQSPQAPQSISEVTITTPVAINEMSSVLVTYKNMFGKYEMPEKDEPFPFTLIRLAIKGDAKLVRLATQSLSLDMGQFYATEQTVPLSDKILFLVSSNVKNIYLVDSNGQRQMLYSGWLLPNKIYDGTIEVK